MTVLGKIHGTGDSDGAEQLTSHPTLKLAPILNWFRRAGSPRVTLQIRALGLAVFILLLGLGVAFASNEHPITPRESNPFAPRATSTWSRLYGTSPGWDSASQVVRSSDGGFLMAGNLASLGLWLVKLDDAGTVIWEKNYSSGSGFVLPTSDGYYLAGITYTFGSGNADAWIAKLNLSGEMLWQKAYGGIRNDYANSIQPMPNGNYIVAGYTNTPASGNMDAWIFEISPLGEIVWSNTYGGPYWDEADYAIATSDGGYLFTGFSSSVTPTGQDAWIVKLGSKGNVVWQKTFTSNGTLQDFGETALEYSDGSYVVAGNLGRDLWVVRLATDGTLIWQRLYWGSSGGSAQSLARLGDGLAVAGITWSFGAGNADVWLLNLNLAGDILWQKTYGGNDDDRATWVETTNDGGLIVAGFNTSVKPGDKDAWVLKLDAQGNFGTSCSQGVTSTGQFTDTIGNLTSLTIITKTLSITTTGASPISATVSSQSLTQCGLGNTYTVSGKVTDDSGQFAPGVTISSNLGNNITTDARGFYTLTSLITGTYTITPTKNNYIFAPITRTVIVPPDAVGKDFRIRTVPPAVFLDIPVTYSIFSDALMGNQGSNTAWLVNSWFDHQAPNYTTNQNLVRWDKCVVTGNELNQPGRGWYDGHNGIDFQKRRDNDPIYPAYGGIVKDVNRNWKSGSCGAKGCAYGNYVLIDHGYGYAGLYAHLDSVNPSINVGTPIASSRVITVGIMGGTGGFETHLHFGVYYDANGNGAWDETYQEYTEAVDPFAYRYRQGCSGPTVDPDPWGIQSRYLWKQNILPDHSVNSSGATLITPAGNISANIPAGGVPSTLTIQLGDVSPIAASSALLRSTGYSFLFQVLEWSGGNPQKPSARRPNVNFAQPVILQVMYGTAETLHLDTSQMKIYYWDEVAGIWSALPTTIDSNLKTATAQTTMPGNFDLQAPLLCSADTLEIDDNYFAAKTVSDRTRVTHLFDIVQDEDWLKLNAVAGSKYQIWTSSLASGVDTVLQIYDIDGITPLVSDDNSGGGRASRLIWQAPQTGIYFIRVSQATGSAFGCNASYQLGVTQGSDSFFPFIKR